MIGAVPAVVVKVTPAPALPLIAPPTVRLEAVPEPGAELSTDQVWLLPSTTGAEMVTAPEPCARVMPAEEEEGAMASVLLLLPEIAVPAAMVTVDTPVGAAVN